MDRIIQYVADRINMGFFGRNNRQTEGRLVVNFVADIQKSVSLKKNFFLTAKF